MLDDRQFWKIANSQEFYDRFRHRHPIIPANGGRDFYNVDNIARLLDLHERQAADPERADSGRWRSQKSAETMRDWIAQISWIERQAELRPNHDWPPWNGPEKTPPPPRKSFAEWSRSS